MTAKSIGAWLRKALSIQVLAAFILGLVIGLVVLAEWRTVDPRKLAAAAILIVAGGILAARA